MNAQDEEFGEDRLMALLRQRSDSAVEYQKRIMAAVTQFSNGSFHDDATILVMTMN